MKKLIWGAAATPLASLTSLHGVQNTKHRIKKGDMYYRRLGRTNLYVSDKKGTGPGKCNVFNYLE